MGSLSVGSPSLVRYRLLGDLLCGSLAGCLSRGSFSLSFVSFHSTVGVGIICGLFLLLVVGPLTGSESGSSISLAFGLSSCSWIRCFVMGLLFLHSPLVILLLLG